MKDDHCHAKPGKLVKSLVEGALAEKTDLELSTDAREALLMRINVEPPPKDKPGHIATNAAFILAGTLQMPPPQVAAWLQPFFAACDTVKTVTIAGGGFVNLTLHTAYWQHLVRTVLQQKETFGCTLWGKGRALNVEYVSTNPTGPLHIGHGRIAVVGDVLANLYAATGFKVTREYYINDAGEQIATLARSLYARYLEALGHNNDGVPEGCYPGEYLKKVALDLIEQHGDMYVKAPASVWQPLCGDFAVNAMMADIKQTLQHLRIHHDLFVSEKALVENGLPDKMLHKLQKRDLVYEGTLPPPKGKDVKDWTPETLTLFKASAFGVPADAPLKNAQGKLTYFGGDVTYHKDKLNRGFDHMVTVWGADHGGHVARLQAAVEVLSGHKNRLKVVLCQMVRVLQGGQPLKMSKRAGQMVSLDELCEAVGPDVLRFMLLTQTQGTHLTLDIEDMLKTSNENPVFYVLYAYARAHSVMRAATETWSAADLDDARLLEAEIAPILKGKTLELVRHLAFWPACVEGAARAAEPHRLTTYLIELARLFHGLWSRGKKETTLRFLHTDDKALSLQWLAILRAMMTVLAHGCAILGIEPREQMFS